MEGSTALGQESPDATFARGNPPGDSQEEVIVHAAEEEINSLCSGSGCEEKSQYLEYSHNLVVAGAAALWPRNDLQPGRKSAPCVQTVKNVNIMCSFVNFQINKAVVGSGCGDMPKYIGKGVVLCGLQGESSGPHRYLNR